jgi:hypothetical protein
MRFNFVWVVSTAKIDSLSVVRGVVIAFGVLNLVLAMFWMRTRREAQRSGEHLTLNVRALLFTRVATYAAIGVCFVFAGLYRSQWFAWIGVSAMLAKVLVESWLRRRERRSGTVDAAG